MHLDAERFAKELNSERGLFAPAFAEGFVRKTDDQSVIEFSPTIAPCLTWIKIPLGMIDRVMPLGKRRCFDHLHDYVVLYFKRPESPEAAVFAELFQHQAAAATMPISDEPASDRSTSRPGYQATCMQQHGTSGPWYGPCRATIEAAKQDQETHHKSWGGFHWGGVNWICT